MVDLYNRYGLSFLMHLWCWSLCELLEFHLYLISCNILVSGHGKPRNPPLIVLWFILLRGIINFVHSDEWIMDQTHTHTHIALVFILNLYELWLYKV